MERRQELKQRVEQRAGSVGEKARNEEKKNKNRGSCWWGRGWEMINDAALENETVLKSEDSK